MAAADARASEASVGGNGAAGDGDTAAGAANIAVAAANARAAAAAGRDGAAVDGDGAAAAAEAVALTAADARAVAAGGGDDAAVDGDGAAIAAIVVFARTAADARAIIAGGGDIAAVDGDGAAGGILIAADTGVIVVYILGGQLAHGCRIFALGVNSQAVAAVDADAAVDGEVTAIRQDQLHIAVDGDTAADGQASIGSQNHIPAVGEGVVLFCQIVLGDDHAVGVSVTSACILVLYIDRRMIANDGAVVHDGSLVVQRTPNVNDAVVIHGHAFVDGQGGIFRDGQGLPGIDGQVCIQGLVAVNCAFVALKDDAVPVGLIALIRNGAGENHRVAV